MIDDFLNTINLLQQNLLSILSLLAILWMIQGVNFITGYRLNLLGLYPRKVDGLPGIALSPLLHGNFNHLFFNSIPFFILGSFVMLDGELVFMQVSLFIILTSGAALWLFGRAARHIGASGLIMGYLGYLITNIFTVGSVVAIGIGGVCIYYFASMLLSIFPSDMKTSFEGHLFGLIAGVAAGFLWV